MVKKKNWRRYSKKKLTHGFGIYLVSGNAGWHFFQSVTPLFLQINKHQWKERLKAHECVEHHQGRHS